MRHFLTIDQLTQNDAMKLIQRALSFKNNARYPAYPNNPVANLFYENSTRTRVSFELAANHLRMPVVNLDFARSSESKGESIADTIQTLGAMGVSLFVIRHSQEGFLATLAEKCSETMHILNAGDGKHAHPSQALLDMMTIVEAHSDLRALKIVLVGDISHSRVANSFQCLSALLGIGELALVAPNEWLPKTIHFGRAFTSLREGLENADVVMCLRVQRERLLDSEHAPLETYRREYGITQSALAFAKPGVLVMHPGPINRDIEIASDVADGPQSAILHQVSNGVFMRMAILEGLIQ